MIVEKIEELEDGSARVQLELNDIELEALVQLGFTTLIENHIKELGN